MPDTINAVDKVSAEAIGPVAPVPVVVEVRDTSELEAHAARVAATVATELTNALALGLASRWDSGLSGDDLAFMRPRIADALREHLAAALQARGFGSTKP